MPAEVAEPKADTPIAQPPPEVKPDAAPPAPEAKAPTAEELDQTRKTFIDNFLPGRREPKKKVEAKVEEKKSEAAPEAPKADAVPAQPAEKQPEKPKPVIPAEEKPTVIVPKEQKTDDAPADDDTELDEQARIDAAVARRMAENDSLNRGERQPSQPQQPTISERDAHLIEVATVLERQNPRYDGLVQKIQDFREQEKSYRQQWIRDNAGQKFNPDEEAHADWYKEHEPTFSKTDFESAERFVERQKIVAEARSQVLQELEPELQETRRERQMQKVRPVIERAVNASMVSVLAAVPEFEKAMDNGDGAYVLSPEREKVMEESNPALYALATEQSDKVIAVVTELEKMNQLGANYRLNEAKTVVLPSGEKIRPHAEILDTLTELEESISAAPAKERTWQGKAFITNAERGARITDIQNSKLSNAVKQERIEAINKAYWTVGAEDIKDRIVKRARSRLEHLSKKLTAPEKKVEKPSPSKNGEHAPEPKPEKVPDKPASRSGSDTVTSSDTLDNRPASMKSKPEGANLILNKLFGG